MNQGSSTSYAVSGEMTEWEDILIKKGITTKDSVLMGKGLNPLDVRFFIYNRHCITVSSLALLVLYIVHES